MFCVRCGRQLAASESFCAACGQPAGQVALMPQQSRLAGHLRLLGILWIAVSAFRLVPGVILAMVFDHGWPIPQGAVPPFIHELIQLIAMAFLSIGAAGIAAGRGLLTHQSWARMLALVLGGLGLVDMPFGTALGIYTFWVLLPQHSEQEYKRIAQTA
jgi:hypothetical protein